MTIQEQRELLKAVRGMVTVSTMYPEVMKNHQEEINHYRQLLSTEKNDEILYGKKEWDNDRQTYYRVNQASIDLAGATPSPTSVA